jgi:oligopeptide transport system ATP-binding protein
MSPLLEVRNLTTRFHTREGVVHAVNGISYELEEGETLGIVGESGSGKSVSVLSLMRLIPEPPGRIEEGQVIFEGRDLLQGSKEEIRHIRGNNIAMVFQDPMTSLNPVLTIGRHLREPLQLHLGMSETEARARSVELLELVGIPGAEERLDDFPHQFSGGMRQRVMIAMGLACDPQILIADEPTTGLDVTIEAQITELVERLQQELGMAVIWITHDLAVVARLADRVAVMYAGHIVEKAEVEQLYEDPRHPYTLGLLGSIPRLDEARKEWLTPIAGLPPNLTDIPRGCPFRSRCPYSIQKCEEERPLLIETHTPDHQSACWRWEEVRRDLKEAGKVTEASSDAYRE